jgi:hypothetical protein
MKRMATGFCVAAALSCVATLGAQAPTATSGEQRPSTMDKAKEISVTGCLSKGADGKYMLTNAKVDNPASATAGTSGTTATPPTTAGAPAATPAAAGSWTLSGGSDLDKHVGHKIQVTGKASMDGTMDHGRTPDTTAAAAGSAAGAATVGTSGSTATAAAEEQRTKDASAAQQLDVQSVKMIAATCS